MKKLLIATMNSAKLAEIQQFLADLPLTLVTLSDVGITQVYEETGETFEENAKGKALFYAKLSGLPAIADDGGLEIDALNGAPGVYSKRWIGRENATTQEYIDFTLEKMKSLSSDKRGAQLRAVIVLATPKQDGPVKVNFDIFTIETKVRGIIPKNPSNYRKEEFPYRSLLFLPEIGKFYNHDEMNQEEEKKYNHRKKALDQLKPFIREKLL